MWQYDAVCKASFGLIAPNPPSSGSGFHISRATELEMNLFAALHEWLDGE